MINVQNAFFSVNLIVQFVIKFVAPTLMHIRKSWSLICSIVTIMYDIDDEQINKFKLVNTQKGSSLVK